MIARVLRDDLVRWLVFVAVAAALPLAGLGNDPYLMLLANVMLIFITLALSWDIVARTGQLSLAHAGFFGLGAYAVAIASRGSALHPLLALGVAALAAGAVALALGVVTLRLRGIYFAIATLAFAEVLRTVALQLPDLTGGTVGISLPPLFGGDRVASYYVALAIVVVALGVSLGIRRSRLHYAVTAIRANETIARVMGVDVVRVKVSLFVVSAVLAALAGGFYVPFITHTDPYDAFDIGRSVASLVFPIFGGLYTTAGPVIGTILLRSLEEYLRVTPPWKDGYQVVYGLVIVVAVLFLPRGLLGLFADARRFRILRPNRVWRWRSSK